MPLLICAAAKETDFRLSRKYSNSRYYTTPGLPSGVSLVICTRRSGSRTGSDRSITALIKLKSPYSRRCPGPATAPIQPKSPGSGARIHVSSGGKLGPYEIVAPLGAGGMGEVYRARDTRLGREVAPKILPSFLA